MVPQDRATPYGWATKRTLSRLGVWARRKKHLIVSVVVVTHCMLSPDVHQLV